jgi:hypothetical protein
MMAFFFPLDATGIKGASKPNYKEDRKLSVVVCKAGTPIYAPEEGQLEKQPDGLVSIIFKQSDSERRAWIFEGVNIEREGPVGAGTRIGTVKQTPGAASGAGFFVFGLEKSGLVNGQFAVSRIDPFAELVRVNARVVGQEVEKEKIEKERAKAAAKAADEKAASVEKLLRDELAAIKEELRKARPGEPLKGGEVLRQDGAPVGTPPAPVQPAPGAQMSTGQKVVAGLVVGGVALVATVAVVKALSNSPQPTGRR